MTFTKFQFNNFCYWPSNPKKIVEFIGGSYLASKPDLTYKRFIESLINKIMQYMHINTLHNSITNNLLLKHGGISRIVEYLYPRE